MMGAGSLQSKYMARKVWVDIDAMSFNFNMFFQAEYNLGLTNINDEEPQVDVQQDEIKTRGFEITGGVLFSL